MKIAVIIIRVLIGLLFLFASVTYFLNVFPPQEMPGNAGTFMKGLEAAGYLLPLVKAIELLCGIAFVTGRFVPLALVLIAPIAINILLVHAILLPEGLPIAVLLVAGLIFLAYADFDKYKPLLEAK
jgi:putative oxidoreductase